MSQTIAADQINKLRELPARRFKRAVLALLDQAEPSRARTREARVSLSSLESKKAEREKEERLPSAWEEAAEREREHLRLPAVRLDVEYRKAVHWYTEHDRELTIGGWLRWAVRAWLDKTNTPAAETRSESHAASGAPKAGQSAPAGIDETDWRHIRGWALPAAGKRPFWAEPWGPPPDHPNCTLPPAAIAHALELRRANARDSAAPGAYPQNLGARCFT
jgi:hypothetical protein